MKRFFTLLITIIASSLMSNLSAQEVKSKNLTYADSVVCATTFFFAKDQGDWVLRADNDKIFHLVLRALHDKETKILVEGWADSDSGSDSYNKKLSEARANVTRKYLEKHGIAPNRIESVGMGVNLDKKGAEGRRADIIAYVKILAPKKEVKTTPEEKSNKAQKTITEDEVKEIVQKAVKEAVDEAVAAVRAERESEKEALDAKNNEELIVEETKSKKSRYTNPEPSKFYMGIGGGISLGKSTFVSLAEKGAKIGANANFFIGKEFNEVLSAELNVGYTSMNLNTYDCCKSLYYADGERYFTAPDDITSYKYSDLESQTKLWTLSTKLNINIVGLFRDDSRWQALVVPTIGVAFSNTDLNHNISTVATAKNTHFMFGGALGAAYSLSNNCAIRLTSGVDYLTGGAFDALPQREHKNGYIWNTTASVIVKF